MPWVHFTADFDWSPPELNGRVMQAYEAGDIKLVTMPCAAAAWGAGKAQPVKFPIPGRLRVEPTKCPPATSAS